MTRAAWFFVGLILIGFVAIAIGIGMLVYARGSTPASSWAQIAFGVLFVVAGLARLISILRTSSRSQDANAE
jgi:putative Mn2+ efflux pump MntP